MTAQRTSIFDIGAEFMALESLIDENGAELTPEVEATLLAWFAELEEDQAVKLERYVGYIRTLEMEAAAATAEAEQYQQKASTRENRVKWLKATMKAHLESRGLTKATTSTGRVLAIQSNGGKLPLNIFLDMDPESYGGRFKKVEVSIDREAVRAALEAGDEVAEATLEPRGTHLRIR